MTLLLLPLWLVAFLVLIRGATNVLICGRTRGGKTLAAARSVVESRGEAGLHIDPHERSYVATLLTHLEGNVLYDRLSDSRYGLPYDLLVPSDDEDEQHRRIDGFVSVLLRRREADSLASTPLLETWTYASLQLLLFSRVRQPLTMLPFAFLPDTEEFDRLLHATTHREAAAKFRRMQKQTVRAQTAEWGSAARLVEGLFRSSAFRRRCAGGFSVGSHLAAGGHLLMERGEATEGDLRVVAGSVILRVIDAARRRKNKYPPWRISIDEATNARLVGRPELKGIAECNKDELYFTFIVQNLDFPDPEGVLNNTGRHEWFAIGSYDLARKAAVDIAAGLQLGGEESRAERIATLTDEVRNLKPGWRWVRDEAGSRKEYCPLLEHPYPDWPGLREHYLQEKLCRLYQHPAYHRTPAPPPSGEDGGETSSPSSPSSPPPPPRSPSASSPSPAERWRRGRSGPTGGS